jgi:glycosyltransferase involved in cell wall biosynthesis
MEPAADLSSLFVVPSASALPTGGNLYNEGLLSALLAQGQRFVRCAGDQVAELSSAFDFVWIDSLYLDQLPTLWSKLPRARWRGLLLHALPSSLAHAAGGAAEPLLQHERRELTSFDCVLATSATAAEALSSLAPQLSPWVVEPAIRRAAGAPSGAQDAQARVHALMIANLTLNKGVLPWLEALAARVRVEDAFRLRCVGRFDLDPAYAEACLRTVRESELLHQRVEFTGVLSEADVLSELARAQLLISASRTESFGMAIADARASGCVVLARAGGHVARLVDRAAGGELVLDDGALAEAFLACVRDRDGLRRRSEQAAAERLAVRSWQDVAQSFLSCVRAHAGGRKAQ